MCMCPVTIKNPTRYLSNGTPWLLQVPCGKCYQCEVRKSTVYHMRAFYEAKSCIDKGGFVYVETLTYSNDNLPRISKLSDRFGDVDFPCFSYLDFRNFMVRLRELLAREGYQVRDNLRYFCTCEYGERKDCTHRPHYHVIFYCTIPSIDSYLLSYYIDKSWQLGRTDGCPYHGRLYVSGHTYSDMSDPLMLSRAINYVSKYVEKQQHYISLIDNRWSVISNKFNFSDDDRALFYRLSSPFHRQSIGFGLSALSDLRNRVERIIETGSMSYMTANGLKVLPLPQYFARKLFYDLHIGIHDKKSWRLNEAGVRFKMSRLDSNINDLCLMFGDVYNSLESSDRFVVDKYMCDRSFLDLARYVLCYKGRVFDFFNLPSYRDAYEKSLTLDMSNVKYLNFQTREHRSYYGLRCVCKMDDDCQSRLVALRLASPAWSDYICYRDPFLFSNKQFLSKVCSQVSYPSFRDFDYVLSIFANHIFENKKLCQMAYNRVQQLRDKFKSIY